MNFLIGVNSILIDMNMHRRDIIAGLATFPIYLSGCLSLEVNTEPNQINLLVLNTTDSTHEVRVTVEDEHGKPILDEQYRLEPDEVRKQEDAISGRRLEVSAQVDDLPASTLTYRQSNCEDEQISIHVQKKSRLRMSQSECHSG